MTTEHTADSEREERLGAVLVDCLEAMDEGRTPDCAELLARHPEFAAELARFLDDQERVERCAAPLRAVVLAAPPAAADGRGSGVLGDFRIIREVGRGGMGVVYEAEQLSLGRRVALKVLPFAGAMDPRHLQRFQNEARAAACLHHTNIVPVHSVGSERGVYFYAMQLIDGQTLAEVIRGLRRSANLLSPPPRGRGTGGEGAAADADCYAPTTAHAPAEKAAGSKADTQAAARPSTLSSARGREYFRRAAELAVQAAEALHHAHQLGIVHRDVKPGNLMLDGGGRLWVTDFGLAHVQHAEASLTMTGDLVGTLRYMSPEQALAKRVPIDHRTDVYSLGATLYELLTLRPAFAGKDRQEVLRQIAFEEPAAPRRLDRKIPAELEVIVLKAMEKNPDERYAAAQDMADDLRRWLEHRPIRARRPTLLQRLRKWGRRHRSVVTTAVVALLAVVAVLGAGVGWVVRDRAARRDEAARRAGAALKNAETFVELENWPEGLRAVEQAEGFLDGFEEETALQLQAGQLRKELLMAGRLQEARLRMAAPTDKLFDYEAADSAYQAAFREYGMDVDGLDPRAVAEQVRARPIHQQLVAALDDWADLQKRLKRDGWKRRLAIARAADPDDGRNRLRDVLDGKDPKALEELAAASQSENWPVPTLALLGRLAQGTASGERVADLLRRAQVRRLGDFWINEELGMLLEERNAQAAIPYYSVAVVLRPQSPGAHLNLGNALSLSGWRDAAMAEYQEVLRLAKDHATAHNDLGVEWMAYVGKDHHGDGVDEAMAEFREAIRLQKDNVVPHHNLGVALRFKGRLDEAIAEYREIIRLQKDYVAAHYWLGEALYQQGQLDEAIAEFREVLRLAKDDPEADNRLGIALLGKGSVVIIGGASRAGAYNGLGCALLDKGQLDEAIALFREAINFNVGSPPELHNNLGVALERKGRLDEAVAEYREAALSGNSIAHWSDGSGGSADLLYLRNLGVALMKKGQTSVAKGSVDEAIAAYRAVLGDQKDDVLAHYNLGLALKAKGQLDEALAEFREAFRLRNDFADAHYNLGAVLHDKGQLDEAIAEFREAVRLKKDHVEAHYRLGRALDDKKDTEGAAREYEEARRLDPNNSLFHVTVGNFLCGKNDLDGALREYQEAVRCNPSYALPHWCLGNLWLRKNIVERAIEEYTEVLRLNENDAACQNLLGWLLATASDPNLRNPEQALAHARKAVDLEPKNGHWRSALGVALYRNGAWQEAVAELDQYRQSEQSSDAFDGSVLFFLAMAHCQLGEKEAACRSYDQGVEWMAKGDTRQDNDRRRFRAEAAALLGITEEVRPK